MKSVIHPGATIGIIGGGQLGRMLSIAAKTMGYRVYLLDPDQDCPAHSVVDGCFLGKLDDVSAAAEMAKHCDVVTIEIEHMSFDVLQASQQFSLVRPQADLVQLIQSKTLQKRWLAQGGFPLGPFTVVESNADLNHALGKLGSNIFLKAASGGYDGRNQVHLRNFDVAALGSAWDQLGRQPCIAESSPQGETKVFPPASNYHQSQILFWSVLPARISSSLEKSAQDLALSIVEALSFEGCLAVEMFITCDGRLLVNELAPRPHNSYHASERACETSQFEQTIRAICNLPLGDVTLSRPSAIVNLLGELWQDKKPDFSSVLKWPGVRLHLYEKSIARAGRKMGHISSVGNTSDEALERALLAYRELLTNIAS